MADLASIAEPGERLGTKEELRLQCEVSVGTFNEALRLAQARGAITVRPGPGGGIFARRPSLRVRLGNAVLALDDDAPSVADAIRVRGALDRLLVEDALQFASRHDVAQMRQELEPMRLAAEALDATAFIRANWALHARIASVSPNTVLRSFYVSLLELVEAHTLSVLVDGEPAADLQDRYKLHADLVNALDGGDRARALDLIDRHGATAPGAEDADRDLAERLVG